MFQILRTYPVHCLARRGLSAISVIIMVFLSLLTLPAHAASYQDIWYTPGEEGWGLNITQQGDILFASWFVQGQDQAPMWFSAALTKTSTNTSPVTYSGPLNVTRAAWFGAAWNPAAVSTTSTGTASPTLGKMSRAISMVQNLARPLIAPITASILPSRCSRSRPVLRPTQTVARSKLFKKRVARQAQQAVLFRAVSPNTALASKRAVITPAPPARPALGERLMGNLVMKRSQ